MIEKDLQDKLQGTSAVTALVSSRVYVARAPQSESRDCIVLSMIDYKRDHLANVPTETVQISCYSTTYTGAKSIALAVVNALQRFHGTMGGTQIVSLSFDQITKRYNDTTGEHAADVLMTARYRP
jgi:hypothetical protein